MKEYEKYTIKIILNNLNQIKNYSLLGWRSQPYPRVKLNIYNNSFSARKANASALNIFFSNKYILLYSIIIMYIIFYILLIYNNNINEVQWRTNINTEYYLQQSNLSEAASQGYNILTTLWDVLKFFTINLSWGIDGINLFLLFLVVIITPIILIIREKGDKPLPSSLHVNANAKAIANAILKISAFGISIIIIELLLLGIFLTLNVFIFYILFEILLIPMFYIIIVFSKKYKRIEASYKLFIYTIIGSFFFILNLIILYIIYGSFNIEILEILLSYDKFNIKSIIWFFFFITFAIKIPMFPFHLWLPEAHTEAPTTGSVLLAAIILKIGAYGFIKFNFILLGSFINYYYSPLIYLFGVLSIIYSNILILRLIDIKKIIAYSSIIHMNYAMIALYSEDINSLIGFYYTLISHGLVSSSLFLLIGVLYRRYNTRNILYFKGLFSVIPIFSILWFYFLISNMSLPLTPSFPGEFLILLGINKNSFIISILISFFLIFSTSYNILLLNKLLYGQISLYLLKFKDLSLNEFSSFLPLLIFSIIFSIFCYPIINNIFLFISYIIL